MKKSLLGLLVCIVLASCSTSAHLRTNDSSSNSFAKTSSRNIKVYSTSEIGAEYIILGEVVAAVDAGTNAKAPVKVLKREASKLGADAIINMRLEVEYGYMASALKATGTAVKIKE